MQALKAVNLDLFIIFNMQVLNHKYVNNVTFFKDCVTFILGDDRNLTVDKSRYFPSKATKSVIVMQILHYTYYLSQGITV